MSASIIRFRGRLGAVPPPDTPMLSLAKLDQLVRLLVEIHGPAAAADYLEYHVKDLRRPRPSVSP